RGQGRGGGRVQRASFQAGVRSRPPPGSELFLSPRRLPDRSGARGGRAEARLRGKPGLRPVLAVLAEELGRTRTARSVRPVPLASPPGIQRRRNRRAWVCDTRLR